MAAKFPSASDVQLRPRKGHDMTWSCDKHGEPIKFYCKDHELPLCHPCAMKDHQKPCKLDDIEDVILEMGTKLEDKLLKKEEMMQCLKRLDSEIHSCSTFVSHHLETMNDEVNIANRDKIKSVEDKEREEILLINVEADEEIQIINEKRETRVTSCRAEAEKQQRNIKDTQARLLSDSKEIEKTVGKKKNDLKTKNQNNIDKLNNMGLKITRIKQDDKTLVNEAPQIIAILDETVSENVHQDIDAYLTQIRREIERVKFVEGKMGGKQFTRIDGYKGKWELVKSFHIPLTVNSPRVRGLIGDDELCVSDRKNLYVSNISNGHTYKVINAQKDMQLTSSAETLTSGYQQTISCAPVDSELIVCGKYRGDCKGDSLDGCITLYDRQWKLVRDITIPMNRSYSYSTSTVYVDVDRDGMILASEYNQSNIYIINSADGKIVHTITMQNKKMWYGIQALSSGDIVVQTEDNEFTVISRSGQEKAVIQCDEWDEALCHVDKLTDTLYITYEDEERQINAVDQVSCDGDIQAKRIVEYKHSDRSDYYSPCLVTLSGNLAACNGDTVLVYKKIFLV